MNLLIDCCLADRLLSGCPDGIDHKDVRKTRPVAGHVEVTEGDPASATPLVTGAVSQRWRHRPGFGERGQADDQLRGPW